MDPKAAKTAKTEFTRICIAQALVDCLADSELEKISVTKIAERAGVARMTFYKHYDRPYEALIDYLNILIEGYVTERDKCADAENLPYAHFLHALQYFDQYKEFFLILKMRNLYGILIDGINRFIEQDAALVQNGAAYELYFYAGGLLNTFLQWEEEGRKRSPEAVARALTRLYTSIFKKEASDAKESSGSNRIGQVRQEWGERNM